MSVDFFSRHFNLGKTALFEYSKMMDSPKNLQDKLFEDILHEKSKSVQMTVNQNSVTKNMDLPERVIVERSANFGGLEVPVV